LFIEHFFFGVGNNNSNNGFVGHFWRTDLLVEFEISIGASIEKIEELIADMEDLRT